MRTVRCFRCGHSPKNHGSLAFRLTSEPAGSGPRWICLLPNCDCEEPMLNPDLRAVSEALNGAGGDEQQEIAKVGVEVVAMLLRKNKAYGSSATAPLRVFSRLEPLEGIKLRMDDKLSRIRNGAAVKDEDPILDLVGYGILYLVARRSSDPKSNNPGGDSTTNVAKGDR